MAALVDPKTGEILGFACGPDDIEGSEADLQTIRDFAEFLKTAGPAPKPEGRAESSSVDRGQHE